MAAPAKIRAKICGITTIEALDAALAHGASHIGLVFAPESPRALPIEAAAALADRARSRAAIVGLFTTAGMAEIVTTHRQVGLDAIQLHALGEDADRRRVFATEMKRQTGIEFWQALGVRSVADRDQANHWRGVADRILLDAKPPAGAPTGGNGMLFDWTIVSGWRAPLPWILSGGLTPDNIEQAVRETGADFVDVSSGVEATRGVKDVDKIARFLQALNAL